MINTKKQGIYTAFIIIGAILLIYDLSVDSEKVYLKVVGLVVLMFGLYSSTRQWANDNDKSKVKDDSHTNALGEDFDEESLEEENKKNED